MKCFQDYVISHFPFLCESFKMGIASWLKLLASYGMSAFINWQLRLLCKDYRTFLDQNFQVETMN